MVHQEAVGQRTKARIDVIEAFIRQAYRHHLDVEIAGDFFVCLDLGAKPVTGPYPGAAAIEQAVSRSFKPDLLVQSQQVVAVLTEPVLEEHLFRAPFMRHEMACNRLVAVDDTGVGGKHHVG